MNLAEFLPQVGAPALYQIGDSPVVRVSGRVRVTDDQAADFIEFYTETLAMGSRRFTLESDSFDGQEWICQFAKDGPYQLEGAAAGWWLQLSLVLVRRIS